ncbi:ADP-ribosylglycohydrolase family protein [Marinobacter sp. F3R08]|uniref:ADP-ribosylglycohydrolase family protein n=1 Tax=Marinobacter sp. F3R08 TaxID=2841559 RepID=UPI001C08368A|nr:ADP-ribosylglycohydrolase family protein [Marinobacter sp. F3R08]MBU2952304.1 ADP-ribosylglycohydrolase family protein [Marinobacter sp. F3R08]
MIGAIVGDIVGSRFEGSLFQQEPIELKNPVCDFTDDTVLTMAVAESLVRGHEPSDSYRRWWAKYPNRGYGACFSQWARNPEARANESTSNGGAMRVSPIAIMCTGQDQVIKICREYTKPTHNTAEALNGAEAIAVLTWFSMVKPDLSFLRTVATTDYYRLDQSIKDYEADQKFELRCNDTVPKAIAAVLEAKCFEDAMINAVKIGGDVDTIACMAGGMAENIWGIPPSLGDWAWDKLPMEMRGLMEDLYRVSGRKIVFDGIEKEQTLAKPSLLERFKSAIAG